MADAPRLVNVSLEKICREQKQPYRLLPGDSAEERPLTSAGGPESILLRAAPMYLGRVNGAVVFGKSYVTTAPDRTVFLGQSHRDYHHKEFVDYYQREVALETRAHPFITEECCFLGGFSGENRFFGHFIFEYLYRLVIFDMTGLIGQLPIAVYDELPAAWLSFVELFGVPKDQILKVPQHPAPRFAAVWVAGCPNYACQDMKGYAFWHDGVRTLHHILRANALAGAPAGPKRVFIGRKGARHRRLLNEDEVWRFLEGEGFVSPDFEGKDAAEQIRLVSSAEMIVTVGGSGSAMTHFAPKNCTIIEILPPHLSGVLGSLGFAAVLGQTFARLKAQVVDDGKARGLENDMTVDIQAVREYVRAALNAVP